jgi:hypothetical protein
MYTMATDKELRKTQPRLVAEIDRWLYEIEHGKPRIQIDQRVTGKMMLCADDIALLNPGDTPDLPMLEAGYEVLEDTNTEDNPTPTLP